MGVSSINYNIRSFLLGKEVISSPKKIFKVLYIFCIMKLLVVGDFHGELPSFIERIMKKEKIDLVVSNGDYLPFHYRKIWFKYCYGTGLELWEVIGKKNYQRLIDRELREGENVLKKLNKLSVPVITVLGNADYSDPDDVADYGILPGQIEKSSWNFEKNRKDYFANLIKKYKNIHRIDYKSFSYRNLVFIGARGHSYPGIEESNAFSRSLKILSMLFKKFSKENKSGEVIFLSHNVPYKTKLDKIGMKANKLVRGKHYGSKLVRKIIDKFQPVLHIGGHIHESRGVQKLRKTLCLNLGALHDKHYSIVEIDNRKVKVRMR